jgi:hypothetical protein
MELYKPPDNRTPTTHTQKRRRRRRRREKNKKEKNFGVVNAHAMPFWFAFFVLTFLSPVCSSFTQKIKIKK